MIRYRTNAIVLRRVNYGEADRIVTFLTEQRGQVSAMVKGARKQGSKLAGGIELFCESDITAIEGRGELDHLISSRMNVSFPHIVSEYERVEAGYEVIKQVAKAARQFTEKQLYDLLKTSLQSLNNLDLPLMLIDAWWRLNLLALLGQQPNLTHDVNNEKLAEDTNYTLLPNDGAFKADPQGAITPQQIKAWRVLLKATPEKAQSIGGVVPAVEESFPTLKNLFEYQFSN